MSNEIKELWPMWLKGARREAFGKWRAAQDAYERLEHKDTVYGLSVKAVADVRRAMLDAACAFPDAIQRGSDEPATPEQPTATE